jgi:hypothetical protein
MELLEWLGVLSPQEGLCSMQLISSDLNLRNNVGFEVLTAVGTKMAVFWVIVPCSMVEVYQRFRGPCCLHQ